MTATLRAQLRDALKPYLPADYSLRPNAVPLETISKPTLQLKQLAMQPAPEAPAGVLAVDFIVTLASPLTAPQAAEDAVDDAVVELLAALDTLPWLTWQRAEKVTAGAGDRYIAYDVTVTVTTNLPQTPTRKV